MSSADTCTQLNRLVIEKNKFFYEKSLPFKFHRWKVIFEVVYRQFFRNIEKKNNSIRTKNHVYVPVKFQEHLIFLIPSIVYSFFFARRGD